MHPSRFRVDLRGERLAGVVEERCENQDRLLPGTQVGPTFHTRQLPDNHRGVGPDVSFSVPDGILLASDECYQDLWFDESATPPPSLLEAATTGVLAFHSCSKRSGMTGYRSGFIAGDAALIAAYKGWRAAMGVGTGRPARCKW